MVDLQPEGVVLRVVFGWWSLVFLLGLPVMGQEEEIEEDPDIYVSVDVGYNSAYRDKTWAPVDVTVTNELDDVKGWVEVRVKNHMGQVQSPVYRVPAECPRNSRKRFRLYCRLDNAERVEAMVYHRNRPAHEAPAWYVLPQPIPDRDILCYVLDDTPTDFGFLYTVMQDEDVTRRVHREHLTTKRLGLLPDYPQCYEAFDLIILGDIDPNGVQREHRELLRQYVANGGVVVINVGQSAAKYRGSWVESFAGVAIHDAIPMTEKELAAAVFPPQGRTGARADRQCLVAQFQPVADNVRRWGAEYGAEGAPVLAALRPMGDGYVCTLAVDATSHALQRCPSYKAIWRDLASMGHEGAELQYDAAAGLAARRIPWLAGISVYSRSSVVAYLGLYFAVGIVGNWLVWSYFQRREMAWLCLLIISVGFTAYAVIFGGVGRADSTLLTRFDVIEIPQRAGVVKAHSLTGIVNARRRTFDAELTGAYTLVHDVSAVDLEMGAYNPGFLGSMDSLRPFWLIQDTPPRVENLRVGASELRLLQAESRIPAHGSVEGVLRWEGESLRGALSNGTGHDFPRALLAVHGTYVPLGRFAAGAEIEVDADVSDRERPRHILDRFFQGHSDYAHREYMTQLLSKYENYQSAFRYSTALGSLPGEAVVIGIVRESRAPGVKVNTEPVSAIAGTLYIAEVTLEENAGAPEVWEPLPVQVQGSWRTDNRFTDSGAPPSLVEVSFPGEPIPVRLQLRQVRGFDPGRVELQVYWKGAGGLQPSMRFEESPQGWRRTGVESWNEEISHTTFTLAEPPAYYSFEDSIMDIEGALRFEPSSGKARTDARASRQGERVQFIVHARMRHEKTGSDRKDWSLWR